jgi:hypothetical protein
MKNKISYQKTAEVAQIFILSVLLWAQDASGHFRTLDTGWLKPKVCPIPIEDFKVS